MNIELYKEIHDFEMDQRAHLASVVNVPIVASTVIGGALSTIILSFKYSDNLDSYLFIGATAFSVIFLAFSVYSIFRSLIGYVYEKIPSPIKLNQYYKELVEWHKENNNQESEAEKDFEDYLAANLARAADKNGRNNRNRGNYVYRANIGLVGALLMLAIAATFYTYNRMHQGEPVYKIQIIGSINTLEGVKLWATIITQAIKMAQVRIKNKNRNRLKLNPNHLGRQTKNFVTSL